MNQGIVVIPTYNERDNIYLLINEILNLQLGLDILIVDDNSVDGTGELVDKLALVHPEIKVIHRLAKLGLGTAYLTAFAYIFNLNYSFVITMDADFSHHPSYLPLIVTQLKNYDLIVGSRYVKGGGTKNWPLYRILLSRNASRYVRIITGMPINDCTAGFMGIRKTVLENIPLSRIKSEGYAFLIDLKFQIYLRGFRLKEIPIIFEDRRFGQSKISKHIIWEAFFLVWRLRFRNIKII